VTGVRRQIEKLHPDALDADEDDDVDHDDVGGPYERSLRDAETMARSWAAWLVAVAELRNEPDAFGPQSFGLIALGSLLSVVKEIITFASVA
jgi:RNA-dependent RNA polymerase